MIPVKRSLEGIRPIRPKRRHHHGSITYIMKAEPWKIRDTSSAARDKRGSDSWQVDWLLYKLVGVESVGWKRFLDFFRVGRPNKSRAKAPRIEWTLCSLVEELDQTKLGMRVIYVYE